MQRVSPGSVSRLTATRERLHLPGGGAGHPELWPPSQESQRLYFLLVWDPQSGSSSSPSISLFRKKPKPMELVLRSHCPTQCHSSDRRTNGQCQAPFTEEQNP